jgi:hypothetical protein
VDLGDLPIGEDIDLIVELGAFISVGALPGVADQDKDRDQNRLHCQNRDEQEEWIVIEGPNEGENPGVEGHPYREPQEVSGHEVWLGNQARDVIRHDMMPFEIEV